MIAKDSTLGKSGRGVIILGLCPPIFLYVSAELFLSINRFYRQDGFAVAFLYGALSLVCLLYAFYIAYCLSFAAKTARIIEYSSQNLRITDYVGRTFFYSIESMTSCECVRLNFLLSNFLLFRGEKSNGGRALDFLALFQDGRSFIVSSRMRGFGDILESVRNDIQEIA